MPSQHSIRLLRTATLEIAYEEYGAPAGVPVILLHGFPDDPRVYDGVVAALAQSRLRLIVPYLRGYGPTRFLDQATLRSGQQAALGKDLLDLMDGLSIPTAILGGYDWGGRAACVVAALWPERVRGLVTVCGYNIQNIAQARSPAIRAGSTGCGTSGTFRPSAAGPGSPRTAAASRACCGSCGRRTSAFDDATFGETAASFANPDFVDVVIHSYRHRYAAVPGDPALEEIERRLAARPAITVPTVSLHGASDGVHPPDETEGHARFFSGRYRGASCPWPDISCRARRRMRWWRP